MEREQETEAYVDSRWESVVLECKEKDSPQMKGVFAVFDWDYSHTGRIE